MCESCPMLGSHKNTGFSQIMGVDSVFVGFVTQLCNPSNVCVCGAWTHVCIHKAEFSTTVQIMPRHALSLRIHGLYSKVLKWPMITTTAGKAEGTGPLCFL